MLIYTCSLKIPTNNCPPASAPGDGWSFPPTTICPTTFCPCLFFFFFVKRLDFKEINFGPILNKRSIVKVALTLTLTENLTLTLNFITQKDVDEVSLDKLSSDETSVHGTWQLYTCICIWQLSTCTHNFYIFGKYIRNCSNLT